MAFIRTALISLALGYLSQLAQSALHTNYLNEFLANNLPTILIALLAINSATTGIVLTKIRELLGNGGNPSTFRSTRKQMMIAVREQIGLIIVSMVALVFSASPLIPQTNILETFISSVVVGSFAYSLLILYDTAIGVLIIVDFDPDNES